MSKTWNIINMIISIVATLSCVTVILVRMFNGYPLKDFVILLFLVGTVICAYSSGMLVQRYTDKYEGK
jgi:Mn2+/Fe2+ NRAMP family transporter